MTKRLLIGLVCIVLAVVASSCLPDSRGNSRSTAVPKETGNGKITIKLLQFKVEIADQVRAMAEDYMALHPHVVIEAEVSKDYEISLVTRFASGDAPDIFSIKSFTDIKDWSDRLADLSNEPWMQRVSPSAVQGMTVESRKLGFPISFEGYGFIYNKDLFEKAGIKEVPTTLSELRQVNEQLQAAGILSYSEGYKEWWILGQHLFNLPFAYQEDAIPYINRINSGEAKVGDLDKLDGFFEVLDMTLKYGRGKDSIGISYDDQVSDFATGKSAMMQQGVWTIESILKINPSIRMGMFAIPLSEDPAETRIPVGVPGYYVVNKNSKHLEESKRFLNWIHRNGQKYLVDSFKLIPAFTDLVTSEELGPLAADLSKYIEENKTIPWAHALWPSGSNQEFMNPFQAYVGGGLNKEQTIDKIQGIWVKQASKSRELSSAPIGSR